jgi:hypothetical protein
VLPGAIVMVCPVMCYVDVLAMLLTDARGRTDHSMGAAVAPVVVLAQTVHPLRSELH